MMKHRQAITIIGNALPVRFLYPLLGVWLSNRVYI